MQYLIHLAILISIYGILGLSLNLVVGFTGLVSVTTAGFFGIGAYVTAILITGFGFNFFAALFAGMVASVVLALAVGAVLSKFKGDYYTLASVGFNVILVGVFLNWDSLTRGPMGIAGVLRPSLFGFQFIDNGAFLVLALVFLGAVFAACEFVEKSSFGRVLKALREDEKAISVFGYDVLYYKLLTFVISAVFAGLAGSLYAVYITFIDPSTFSVFESIYILAIVILGGLASNRGALLGATVLVLLPEVLRFVGFPSEIAAQMRELVYGLLLVVLMLYRPTGLMGEYKL